MMKDAGQILVGRLFQPLAKVAGAASGLGAIVDGVAEVVSVFGPEDTLEESGWRLVYGALQGAIDEAGAPLRTSSGAGQRLTAEHFLQFGGRHVDLTTIEIPAHFLGQPKQLTLLSEIEPIVKAALIHQGMDDAVAGQRAQLLPVFFVAALADIWRKDRRWLDAIEQLTDAAPEIAARQERAWLYYRDGVERDLARPLFGGPKSLLDLYQPLRGYWTELPGSPRGERHECRHVVDIAKELTNWIEGPEADDLPRVVSGGPGSGKSSLVKWWAAERLRREPPLPTLIVPLHRIWTFDLEAEVDRFARSEGFAQNPVDAMAGEPNLVLILDGLDELDVDQRTGPQQATQLVTAVVRLLREAQGQNLRVLLAGREVVVSALRGWFDRPRLVLHVLGYLTDAQRQEHDIGRNHAGIRWDDPDNKLATDQRRAWWRAWLGASGNETSQIPAAIAGNSQLIELSDQPLLNHLLAIVHRDGASEIDEHTTLNGVYAGVLSHVWRRTWGYSDEASLRLGKIPGLQPLTEDDLQRVFESIGLAVWQYGSGRSITLARLGEVFEVEGLDDQLAGFTAVAKSTALDLLTAFYFRRDGAAETFELTHRSFGDYLAAKRLLRLILDLHEALTSNDIERREALRRWYHWTHSARITPEIVDFLEGDLRTLEVAELQSLRGSLIRLFDQNLRTGMVRESAECSRQPTSQREAQQFDSAAELALFAAIGACTEAIIHRTADLPIEERRQRVRWSPAWPDYQSVRRTSAWDLLRRLEAGTARDTLARRHMQGLDLTYQVIGGDLAGARLTYAVATDSDFRRANFFRVDLRQTDLSRAVFRGANLSGVNLDGASLRSADLFGANLIGALFGKADLTDADLSGSVWSAVDLLDAETTTPLNWFGPNFWKAKLVRAKLGGEFCGANFCEADMTSATLNGADLTRADLAGANLSDASLSSAILHSANLYRAILERADLRSADLSRTNFDEADLSGADLRGATGLTRLQLQRALNVDQARLPADLPEGSEDDMFTGTLIH